MHVLNCTILDDQGVPIEALTPVHVAIVLDTDPHGPWAPRATIEELGRLILRFADCTPEAQGMAITVHAKGYETTTVRGVTPKAGSWEGPDWIEGSTPIVLARGASTTSPF